METVRIFIISYHGDFIKERDILYKEVLPDLRAWCESKRLQLQHTDVQWGGYMSKKALTELVAMAHEAYYNGQMPFFTVLTSDNLGLVPMWGEAPERVIADIQHRLNISDDEMDVLHGAYRADNPNNLVLVREDGFLQDLEPRERKSFFKRDILSDSLSGYCCKSLENFPEERKMQFHYDFAAYDPSSQRVVIEMDKQIFRKVTDVIKSRLAAEYPVNMLSWNLYDGVRESHEAFMMTRSLKVRGREEMLSQIEEYVWTEGPDVPLLVLGGAGSGKSSVMACAAQSVLKQAGDRMLPCDITGPLHVFYHFVGAVPGSTELVTMLKRLLRELDITMDSALPKDLNALAQMSCNALSNTATRPVILFVDAVNQFDEDQAAQIISWLPRKLAPHVRCVLSMINDTPQHKVLVSRESHPRELHLVPLSFRARQDIVEDLLGQYNQTLTLDQMNLLMSKKASENPLWLSVACEQLRAAPDPRRLQTAIRDLPDGLLDLLEYVLGRLESENGDLLVATLCLLEASCSGLLESELQALLDRGSTADTSHVDIYEEKEEKESSEKAPAKETSGAICREDWLDIFRPLRPYLRPYGDSHQGRLDFYHRAFSKAIRRRYFKYGAENESSDESQDIYSFWHQKLANFFETSDNMDRKLEEYMYHLTKLNDTGRLATCLTDWQIFDRLYSDEYSAVLLQYWRKAGGAGEMARCYQATLAALEAEEPRDDNMLARRYEHVSRILLQSGRYGESLALAQTAMKLEEKELGQRSERMVELFSLMSEIYDEKLKLNDFVSRNQLPDLRKTISYGRKSIELREKFSGEYHQFKVGMSLMKLAFSLESWFACGGNRTEMTESQALSEGNRHIDRAIQIFQELKDLGHYAEALMTKGVLAPRGSNEQLKLYNQSMEICRQVYGEQSLLSSRLYINIGIVHEDNRQYVKAFQYFRRWAETSELVLGPDHPKTQRAKGVLREPRYRLIAGRLTQQRQHYDNSQSDVIDEESINAEVADLHSEAEDGSRDDDGEEDEFINMEYYENDEERRDLGDDGTRDSDTDADQNLSEARHMMQRIIAEIMQRMASGQPGDSPGDAQGQDATAGRQDNATPTGSPPGGNTAQGSGENLLHRVRLQMAAMLPPAASQGDGAANDSGDVIPAAPATGSTLPTPDVGGGPDNREGYAGDDAAPGDPSYDLQRVLEQMSRTLDSLEQVETLLTAGWSGSEGDSADWAERDPPAAPAPAPAPTPPGGDNRLSGGDDGGGPGESADPGESGSNQNQDNTMEPGDGNPGDT